MRDNTPGTWNEAFAALPSEQPPTDAWRQLAVRLPSRRRAPAWIGLAAAATLVAVLVAPWERREPRLDEGGRIAASAAPTSAATASAAPASKLDTLYTESAQLEALLAVARDDRVSSASAALLSYEMDARIVAIDASLARADLTDDERLQLWQARVDALRQAAGFESTQRLLASQGRSDVMLVSVD